MMAPAAVDHDDVVGWLIALIKLLLALRPTGSVHGPEVLVRLHKIRRRRLPDVAYVSSERRSIVENTEIVGPPDMIIEVVSPDSIERDWFEKYSDYERAGVHEYWAVDRLADRVKCLPLKPRRRHWHQAKS